MTVFNLRNKMTIDLNWGTPQLLNPQLAKPIVQPNMLESKLDCHPLPIDNNGRVISNIQVMNLSANGVLSGATPSVFERCFLRFIQFIKVEKFELMYLGSHPDNGLVTWGWRNRLLQRNNDCLVRKDGNTFPFQFDLTKTLRIPPNRLSCNLGDTPGAGLPLLEVNPQNNETNYLRQFTDIRRFVSIVAFVHPDESFEMLEGWHWAFKRSVKLRWKRFQPEIDGENIIEFKKADKQENFFGRDDEFADTLNGRQIANELTDAAMANYRASVDISYTARASYEGVLPDGFWQAKT